MSVGLIVLAYLMVGVLVMAIGRRLRIIKEHEPIYIGLDALAWPALLTVGGACGAIWLLGWIAKKCSP